MRHTNSTGRQPSLGPECSDTSWCQYWNITNNTIEFFHNDWLGFLTNLLNELSEIQTRSSKFTMASNLTFTTAKGEFAIACYLIQNSGSQFIIASNLTENEKLLAILNLPSLIWIKLLIWNVFNKFVKWANLPLRKNSIASHTRGVLTRRITCWLGF